MRDIAFINLNILSLDDIPFCGFLRSLVDMILPLLWTPLALLPLVFGARGCKLGP